MRIHLENFGQHEDLKLDPGADRVCLFVVGKNRIGKSTIRDAVEFAVLGSCKIRGLALKKDVATHMIRNGKSSTRVTLCTGTWSVRRTLSRGGSSRLELSKGPGQEFEEINATQWHDFIGADADAVRVALDCEQFYRMDEKDRRKLLIAVKDSEGIDAKTIWDSLGSALTSFADEEPARSGKLRAICETAALVSFKEADDKAVQFRRDGKRDAEDIKNRLAAMEPEAAILGLDGEPIDVTTATLAEHQAKLAELRTSLRKAQDLHAAAGGEAEGRLAEAIEQAGKADGRLLIADAQVVTIDIDGKPVIFDSDAIAIAINKCQERQAQINPQWEAAYKDRTQAEEAYSKAKEAVAGMAALVKAPSQCPAVSFNMQCPVRPTTFQTAYGKGSGDDRGNLAVLQGEAVKAGERSIQANALLENLKAQHDDVKAALGEWEEWARQAAAQDKEREEADRDITVCDERIVALKAEVENALTGPTDEDLEAMENRVALGIEVIAVREAYDRRTQTETKLLSEYEAVELETLWWDEVEKCLRPDGIEASLASLATSQFAKVLESCDSLAEVRITDAMEISINGNHIATRSKSEQLCGGIALQAAMCFQIGLPFLIIDEVDKLDDYWKKIFVDWAGTARASYVGGIVALATSDASPPGIPPDGFVTGWLRDSGDILHLGTGFDQ